MKIDLGNFGFAPRQVVDAQVDRGDPTALAQAQSRVAEQQQRSAEQVNQAWNQVGRSLQSVSQNAMELISDRAKLQAANSVKKKEADTIDKFQALSDAAAQGKIKSEDILPEFQKWNDSYKTEDIDGLGPASRARYEQALAEVSTQYAPRFHELTTQTHKAETTNELEKLTQQEINNGFKKGMKPEEIVAAINSPTFDAMRQEVYGPQAEKAKHAAGQEVYSTYALQTVDKNQRNIGGLSAFAKELNDPNSPVFNNLDADTRIKLHSQVTDQIYTLQRQAEAEQRQRINDQQHQENLVMTLFGKLSDQTNKGYKVDAQSRAQLEQLAKGTRLAGIEKNLDAQDDYRAAMTMQPLYVTEAALQQEDARLKTLGGNAQAVDDHKNRQAAFESLRKGLTTDPITTMSTNLGVSAAQMPGDAIMRLGTKAETPEDKATVNSWIVNNKTLSAQARQLTPEAPMRVTTNEEAQRLKAIRNNIKSPTERAALDRQLYAADPQLLKDAGGDDADLAAAHYEVNNPTSGVGEKIVQGRELLAPENSPYRMAKANATVAHSAYQSYYGDVLPYNVLMKQQQNVDYHYAQLSKETQQTPGAYSGDYYENAFKSQLGTVEKIGGWMSDGKIFVPSGNDSISYVTKAAAAINARPDGAIIMDNLHSGSAKLIYQNGKHYLMKKDGVNPWYDAAQKQIIIEVK